MLLPHPLTLLPLLLPLPLTYAWLPATAPSTKDLHAFTASGTTKIRGVNLGSQFIVEPWMAQQEWIDMGCSGAAAEFQCIRDNYGGDIEAASVAWKSHWGSWITQADVERMRSYGLNSVRIPVGWWMKEDLVEEGEYFPKGGIAYLEQICDWLATAGFYIIVDLHAAPGTQDAEQPFTGNYSTTASFYQSDYQSGRAYSFLTYLTNLIHKSTQFRNTGTLGILNEPKYATTDGDTSWLLQHYYPSAIRTIRAAEAALNIPASQALHIALMDDLWGSGGPDPSAYLSADLKTGLLFDDHNYEPVSGEARAEVLKYACADERVTALEPGSVKVVGEWAMDYGSSGPAVQGDWEAWFGQWFAAQMERYEETLGWCFWSWKVDQLGLGNWVQWSYSGAVEAGLISSNLNAQLAKSPC